MMKRLLLLLITACLPAAVIAQNVTQNAAVPALGAAVLRADTLRAEPYADAKAVIEVPAGGKLQLLERKGTWANAEYQGRRGWLRALNLKADGAVPIKAEGVLSQQTGRAAQGGGVAVPLAVRSARPPRHAALLLDDLYDRRDASRALNFSARIAASGEIEFSLDSPRPGFAHVFSVDPAGRVLRCLYPNAASPDHDIAAGRALSFSTARADAGDRGAIRLLALVSDAPLELMLDEKEAEGAYFRLAVTEDNRPRLAQAIAIGVFAARGAVLPASK